MEMGRWTPLGCGSKLGDPTPTKPSENLPAAELEDIFSHQNPAVPKLRRFCHWSNSTMARSSVMPAFTYAPAGNETGKYPVYTWKHQAFLGKSAWQNI